MISQIPATVTRILLNHFKWDKEKLMERLYGGDPDTVFTEAHVISPYRKNYARQPKVILSVRLQISFGRKT